MLGAVLLAGCADEERVDGFSAAEWTKIRKMSPLPEVPLDPTNRYVADPAASELGQRFFFEKAYSGPLTVGTEDITAALGRRGETGKMGCVSCHSGPWLIDPRGEPTSLGSKWLPRNASSMLNVPFYAHWYENDGLLDTIWGESIVDIEWDVGFNSSRSRLAHVIYDKYRTDYDQVFGDYPLDPALAAGHPDAARFPQDAKPKEKASAPDGDWERMRPEDRRHVTRVMANFGKSVHAYLQRLISRNAPFDRYVAGDHGALMPAAKRGLRLFIGKAACVECHAGPELSDLKFHNVGMALRGEHINPAEKGRFDAISFVRTWEFNSDSEWSDDRTTGRLRDLMATEEDKGRWRTKGLRHIAKTAPYMHTGQFKTLKEVVHFYNEGGDKAGFVGTRDDLIQPLNLTEQEEADLVAFLESLTGEEAAPDLLRDTSAR